MSAGDFEKVSEKAENECTSKRDYIFIKASDYSACLTIFLNS